MQLLADGLLFEHRGRAVLTSMMFDEPVTLFPVDGSGRVSMRWDALGDMGHGSDAGSDVGDQHALAGLLGRILDDPVSYGATRIPPADRA